MYTCDHATNFGEGERPKNLKYWFVNNIYDVFGITKSYFYN